MVVGGCGSKIPSPGGGTLKVIAPDLGVQVGATEQLRAQLVQSDGSTEDVTGSVQWSSSDTKVAQVNSAGLVTSIAPGKATIQATLSANLASAPSASTDVIVTKLFGVTECCPNNFVILAPSVGNVLPPLQVGDITTGFTVASATDPVNHRFYVFPMNGPAFSMVTIDTQSATVVSTQQLTGGLFTAQWDQQTGNVLAITDCCPNQLVSINVTTGNATPIAPVGDATVSFINASAIDQVNHRFYFIRFDSTNIASLVGMDPSTGSVTAQFALTGPVPFLMGWNASTGKIVGLAGINSPPTNPFVALDPATGAETILAGDLGEPDLQGWDAFVSAIDSVRNRFYAIRVDIGNGGPATSASLNAPSGVTFDAAGNLYIADSSNNRIRKVDTSGVITTVAGNGTAGYGGDGGSATSASLNAPSGVTFGTAGNLYIADSSNNRIRKVDTSGVITTVAGNGTASYGGDGGSATSASLNAPRGVTFDTAGNLYIADSSNNRIRKVDTSGVITTVAGNGTAGYGGDGGLAISASLNVPSGVTFDTAGNLYIADSSNNRIRKVDPTGSIVTTAGTAGNSNQLVGIDTASGAIRETLRLQRGIILLGSE